MQRLVILLRQLPDVPPHRLHVPRQRQLARLVRLRVDVLVVGRQRNLGIDDEVLVLRQLHDHIRPRLPRIRIEKTVLHQVFLVLAQPARLQNLLQDHLAQIALCLGLGGQRARQPSRLAGELLVQPHQQLHLLA